MELSELINESRRPPAARGRKAVEVAVSVVRELDASDMEALHQLKDGELSTVPEIPVIQRIRHRHHLVARLLAQGTKEGEIALISGMDVGRISILKKDPAFADLVKYYEDQVKEVFISVHERLMTLGLTSIDELVDRMEADPSQFSNKEIMEAITLCSDRVGAGPSKSVTLNTNLGTITPARLAQLKGEVERRQNGTVERLPAGHRPEMGEVITLEPLAEDQAPDKIAEGGDQL